MAETSSTPLLQIEELGASVDGKPILNGVNLTIQPGEVHALMGPNGSGKSTLAYTLMGHPHYEVTGGRARLLGQDLLSAMPEERARAGLFLSFQQPVAIPGVTTVNFIRAALRSQEKEMPAREFLLSLGTEMEELRLDASFRQRYINDGFSGGEKKRAEMLQMALLRPKLAILDEPDSGLDVDGLKVVADAVQRTREGLGKEMGVLLITHYNRMLTYIPADHVHILHQGRIVESGGPELALRVEAEGYEGILGVRAAAGGEA